MLTEQFTTKGFIGVDLFDELILNNVSIDFYNRLALQAYKIGIEPEFKSKSYNTTIDASLIDDLVQKILCHNKISIDFASAEMRESPSVYRLVNQDFLNIISDLINCPEELLKVHFDGVLVNPPSNTSLLYKFHSEKHYYPKRNNFINFWMPIIREKTSENGAMTVKPGAHLLNYSFNEYSGYHIKTGDSISETVNKYQLEISEDQLKDFDDHCLQAPAGHSIFFDKNLPHKSNINNSSVPSYALIARIYDFRGDYTLSDYAGVKSYTQSASQGGYPNIKVFNDRGSE